MLAGIGCLVIVDFKASPFEYTETQYIAGISLTFVAMQAHEGVIMSVTSKIIPLELARYYCWVTWSGSCFCKVGRRSDEMSG